LTDPLTGLNNRRYFEQIIEHDLQLCLRQRHEQQNNHHLIFLLLDLDHFKQVNDHYGHAAGDAVLQQTASLLKQILRASDRLIRWGGEEFLLIAHGTDNQDALRLAEKIRDQIAAQSFVLPDQQVLRKTVSIGVVCYPFFEEEPTAVGYQSLLQLADAALYQVKSHGRNNWRLFAHGPHLGKDNFAEQLELLVQDPERAIAKGLLISNR
jgi:diguanylate cyclase (GGDEF)-like protein